MEGHCPQLGPMGNHDVKWRNTSRNLFIDLATIGQPQNLASMGSSGYTSILLVDNVLLSHLPEMRLARFTGGLRDGNFGNGSLLLARNGD